MRQRLIDANALMEYCNNLVDKTIDANDIARFPTAVGWISVKDRLPEEKINPYTQDYQEVICLLSTRFGSDVRVYKFGRGHFWNGPCDIDKYITHWMYLPEPPKEVTGDD